MTDVRDKIQLKKPDGTIIAELPMYRSLYEVPLNRYIDFIKAEEPLHDKEKLEAGEINVARVLAKCVGEFFGVPLNSVLDAHYGNTDDIPSGGLQSLYVDSQLGRHVSGPHTDAAGLLFRLQRRALHCADYRRPNAFSPTVIAGDGYRANDRSIRDTAHRKAHG